MSLAYLFVTPWTDARVTKLKALAETGLSAAQIAVELGEGCTRNAVIGKLGRLGIRKVCRPTAPRLPRTAKTPNPVGPLGKLRKLRIHLNGGQAFRGQVEMVDTPAAVPDLPPDVSADACSIMALTETSCRWPLGEPTRDMLYCGAEQHPGCGSYCVRHAILAYRPAERR